MNGCELKQKKNSAGKSTAPEGNSAQNATPFSFYFPAIQMMVKYFTINDNKNTKKDALYLHKQTK